MDVRFEPGDFILSRDSTRLLLCETLKGSSRLGKLSVVTGERTVGVLPSAAMQLAGGKEGDRSVENTSNSQEIGTYFPSWVYSAKKQLVMMLKNPLI